MANWDKSMTGEIRDLSAMAEGKNMTMDHWWNLLSERTELQKNIQPQH